MAAPVAGKIILPSDTGNTGKNVRTQTRVIGADTVHEHFFVPIGARNKIGVHYFHSGRFTVQAAAHGALAGFMWLLLPTAVTGKLAALRAVEFSQGPTAATAFVSSPRVTLERVTFTGTPSGAAVTPARRDSTDVAPVVELRTASTGMTITAGALINAFMVGAVLTAVGNVPAVHQIWRPADSQNPDEESPVIRPGEALVLRQPDAGTTADTRVCWVDLVVEEYEV